MIKSMTGYGKAECELANKKITVEIKSLNSKQLDINSRFPSVYREKDLEVRKIISEKLVRGKIDFSLFCEQLGASTNTAINKPIVMSYYTQLADIYKDMDIEITERIVQTILRLPDAVKTDHEELDEKEWAKILFAINDAIGQVDQFRQQEGAALENDIISHIERIVELEEAVKPFEAERMERIKTKLSDALKEIAATVQPDQNRYEQELIFYLEKLDINEEKVRLKNHCTYFVETLKYDNESGKKLGFISQEIGREINTMGSKANHAEIQKLVIQMKDELEKIKEQSLNIL